MRGLLFATAVVETAAGLALALAPLITARALFGPSVALSSSTQMLVRLAGAIPLALGAAHGLAIRHLEGRAARALVAGMALYNIGAVAGLAAAGIRMPPGGVLLGPSVLLHAIMTVWCARSLGRARRRAAPSHRGEP
jgi:hypothetical protein